MNDNTFKIRNYTTDVPAARTIYEIEELLIQAGAAAIMKDYRGDGRESLYEKIKGQGGLSALMGSKEVQE